MAMPKRPWTTPLCVGLFLALSAGPAAAQAESRGEPGFLTLDEVLDLARARNPRLLAAQSLAEATSAREDAAGLLPDPTLQLGVMNLGLPDLSSSMPASMAPAIQAMQVFPFPGKLSLRREIAERSTEMAEASAEEVWWDVRTKTAKAFYELYATDRRLVVMRATRKLLENFETVANAMYSAGTGRQADVLRANVEIARMDADITRMESARVAAAARLNGLLDRPADTPVGDPTLGSLPNQLPATDTLLAWAEESRPLIRRSLVDVDRADREVALARKEIWPNVSLGLQYGQRSTVTGTQHMGGLMVGFSLPVFAGSRQLRLRDEAAAMKQMAEAELGSVRANVDASLGETVADLDWSRALIGLYRSEILPQARATVESSFSSYRVGAVDFMTLVDAEMAVNRFEAELYVFLSKYGTAVAELERTIGRQLPLGAEILAEVP